MRARLGLLPASILALVVDFTSAYKALSDNFLRLIPSGGADLDATNGALLAPLLVPRLPGSAGQTAAQHHFVRFFRTELPRWELEWQNSTTRAGDGDVPIANLVFRREPPWVRPGQANLLTLAAHYDTRPSPPGFVGATDSAASCAVLMHVARSLDRYAQQMYDEMEALGEHGGTLAMDMGVQVVFLDGKEAAAGRPWAGPALAGSRALAAAWEAEKRGPAAAYGFPTALNQVRLLVLLDRLGRRGGPEVPSYVQTAAWAYRALATVEARLRRLALLETPAAQRFLPQTGKRADEFGGAPPRGNDHEPFMARGVDVLALFPDDDDDEHAALGGEDSLDPAAVRDWARIMTGFALEWLDMMEVEPVSTEGGS